MSSCPLQRHLHADLRLEPDEFDPWVGCEAGAGCTVDIRIVLAWWHYEPDARFPITWDLGPGWVAGRPVGPEGQP
jgi:hypothetical protein